MCTGSLAGDVAAGSEARRDQLQRRHERLREGWPVAARTGTLGGDAAAGSEARRDQLQRRHERLRKGWPVGETHKSTTASSSAGVSWKRITRSDFDLSGNSMNTKNYTPRGNSTLSPPLDMICKDGAPPGDTAKVEPPDSPQHQQLAHARTVWELSHTKEIIHHE